MQVTQDLVYVDVSTEPCLSTQRSPPQPRIRMETIELVTFRDTQTLSGTFTIGKCGLVIFLISEGIWQLICSNLQMHTFLNFWSRFTCVCRRNAFIPFMQFSDILLDVYLPLMLGNAISVPSLMKIPSHRLIHPNFW